MSICGENPCLDAAAELPSFVEKDTEVTALSRMSICVENSWLDVAAELPSFVEVETEATRDRVERRRRLRDEAISIRRRQEDMVRNKRILIKKYGEEIMRDTPDSPEREADTEEDDILEMHSHRRCWEYFYDLYYGAFEDNTSFGPMRHTEGIIPPDARSEVVLEIFSIQVTEIKDGLEWPLHVYGYVAVRDNVDYNRNILFNRKWDNCQILTQQDSYLLLTGPSRPVLIVDPITFEVDLKVRGETELEDKILSLKVFELRRDNFINLRHCISRRSTVDFAFAVDPEAVEATVDIIKVISGSWPDHLRGRVVSRTARIVQKDVVLLDSRDERMPIASDGKIELSRRVLSVPVGGELTICVEASEVGDKSVVEKKINFKQQHAGWSKATCLLGFCEVEIHVAWSLFSVKMYQHSRMRAGILSNLHRVRRFLSENNV